MNNSIMLQIHVVVFRSFGKFEYLVWLELSFQALFIGTSYMVLECILLTQKLNSRTLYEVSKRQGVKL